MNKMSNWADNSAAQVLFLVGTQQKYFIPISYFTHKNLKRRMIKSGDLITFVFSISSSTTFLSEAAFFPS